MHALYYNRKRDQHYDEKPLLSQVFAFIGASEKPIKTLLFTAEESKQLESEIRQLAADVNFYKLKDAEQGVARIIGYPYEVLDTVTKESKLYIDKRR